MPPYPGWGHLGFAKTRHAASGQEGLQNTCICVGIFCEFRSQKPTFVEPKQVEEHVLQHSSGSKESV